MTFRPCWRVACDAPGCQRTEMVPHERAAPARRQLRALGWTFVRWRVPRRGLKWERWRPSAMRRVLVADTGGPGRLLSLCPRHRVWRPARGYER